MTKSKDMTAKTTVRRPDGIYCNHSLDALHCTAAVIWTPCAALDEQLSPWPSQASYDINEVRSVLLQPVLRPASSAAIKVQKALFKPTNQGQQRKGGLNMCFVQLALHPIKIQVVLFREAQMKPNTIGLSTGDAWSSQRACVFAVPSHLNDQSDFHIQRRAIEAKTKGRFHQRPLVISGGHFAAVPSHLNDESGFPLRCSSTCQQSTDAVSHTWPVRRCRW